MKNSVSMEDIKNLRAQTGVGLTKCKEALESCDGDLEQALLQLRKMGLASAGKKEARETREGIIGVKADEKGVALIEVNVETDFVANNDVFRSFVGELVEALHKFGGNDLEAFVELPYPADASITLDQQRAVVMQTVGENIRISRIQCLKLTNPDQSIGVYSHGNGRAVSVVVLDGAKGCEGLAKDIAMHVVASSPEYISSEDIPAEVLEREKDVIASQIQGKPQEVVNKIVNGKLSAFYKDVCLLEQGFVKNPDQSVSQLLLEEGKSRGAQLSVADFLFWKIGA